MNTFEERFWAKVDKRGPDECWEWTAVKSRGYGQIWRDGRMILATHAIWEINHEPVPNGFNICHKCDNPSCVNPNHLFLGTQKDNIRDMVRKGRNPNRRGEKNPVSKLTESQVVKIKRLHAGGIKNYPKLASMFGVSKYAVANLFNGRCWQHIKIEN